MWCPLRIANALGIVRNVRRSEDRALQLWRSGYDGLCPHTNPRLFQGAADDDVWLRGDVEMLKRCDAIALVDGWEQSDGARSELQVAQELGLDVIDVGGLER